MNTAVGDTQGPEQHGRGSQTGSAAGLGQVGPGPPPQGAVVGGRQRTHRSLGPGPPSTVVAGLQPAGAWRTKGTGNAPCSGRASGNSGSHVPGGRRGAALRHWPGPLAHGVKSPGNCAFKRGAGVGGVCF